MMSKKNLALLTLVTAAIATPVAAQQLPGESVLGSARTVTSGSRQFREYFTSRWRENLYYTAALVSSAINAGPIPGCDATSSNYRWISAKAQLRVRIIDGGGVVKFKNCTTDLMRWPPTGDQLLITTYPGGFAFTQQHHLEMTIRLPLQVSPQPWATEWTLF